METRSGKIVSLPTHAHSAEHVGQESHVAAADAGRPILSLPVLSPQVTLTGALNMLENQEVTSDTELLAVADRPTLLSLDSQPTSQQTPPIPVSPDSVHPPNLCRFRCVINNGPYTLL